MALIPTVVAIESSTAATTLAVMEGPISEARTPAVVEGCIARAARISAAAA